jgi:ABC-type sugar transport systems, ATPase components
MLGLEGLEARRPAALSGGQRQRVALARAVVSGHPLCLMDEPLSNLDAKLRHAVRRDIRALQRRLGLTVVYVTHDQTEAMSLSDAVALMRDGRLEQLAAPAELYDRPVSVFAAEFVGDPPMAVVQGEALGAPGTVVGVRPEHLARAPEAAADLVGEVREIEYLGARTLVVVDHPAARGLILSVPGRAEAAPGERIGLALPPDRWVRFDADDGRARPDPAPHLGPASAIAARRTPRGLRHEPVGFLLLRHVCAATLLAALAAPSRSRRLISQRTISIAVWTYADPS